MKGRIKKKEKKNKFLAILDKKPAMQPALGRMLNG
jgi:hypothetical protein